MNKLIFTITIFSFIFASCNVPNVQQDALTLEKKQIITINIIFKIGENIRKKYNIEPLCAGGVISAEPIKEIDLTFESNYLLTKEELRILLIKSAQEALQQINQDVNIQLCIIEHSLTINNINITIFNSEKVKDTEIGMAQISQGKLIYETIDIAGNCKDKFEESYEEALEAMKVH